VPKENTHSRRWVERKLPDGSRVFGSRVPGEDGTITFLANGKVAVGVGGSAFFKQGRKVISRFKANPELFEELEAIFQPPFDSSGSELLHSLVGIANQTQFDRSLDALVSTLRAIHELRIGRFGTRRSRRFINAIHSLAVELWRPPTKHELTERLCIEPSQTSRLCTQHGFEWLPTGPPGRKRK
jgi:hypothetical protein